ETEVSTAEPEPLVPPVITRITDGGLAVAWADARESERIRVQRFAIDGTKNGPDFRANTAAGLHRVPMLAGLANGNIVVGWGARILVAWTESNVDNPAAGTNVGARIFSTQGPFGQAIQVNTLTGGERFSLSASTTSGPSGETAFFAWSDDTSAGSPVRSIKGR